MKCFVYRHPEEARISVFNADLNDHEDVDPVDHIEGLAIGFGLKHARVTRTISVCIDNEADLLKWRLAQPVAPFMEYLGYP